MTAAKGFVVPAGGGKHHASPTPGRFFDLKLFGRETGDSIMLFEETLPPGTRSLYHLHHESDEVAWVIAGEMTFKIGDEVAVAGLVPACSCRAQCRTPGRTPAATPPALCSSTPLRWPAAISRKCPSCRPAR